MSTQTDKKFYFLKKIYEKNIASHRQACKKT